MIFCFAPSKYLANSLKFFVYEKGHIMRRPIITILMMLYASFAGAFDCTNNWLGFSATTHCDYLNYQTFVQYPVTSIFGNSPDSALVKAKIRAGYLEENKNIPFRGNILYFEGLADSMLNHQPLFNKLTNSGFRVIAFDYMGQGGSSGTMNDTRLEDIQVLGKIVYKKYARDLIKYNKPIIIGWSTGGLAAYLAALSHEAAKVILIAPGIVPNIILGEQNFWELSFDKITLNTLTSKRYQVNEYNPHLEGIRPKSPLEVKDFATDLILSSFKARSKKVDPSIKGLVLLSGVKDTYVNSISGENKLNIIAPHFHKIFYINALHEIDNEVGSIQENLQKQILNFLLE